MELAIQTDPLFEQVMVVGEARPFITALAVVNEAEWENKCELSSGNQYHVRQ